MRVMAIIFLLLTATVLSGCSGTIVSQDYDPQADMGHYRTWQWRQPVQPMTGDIRADNPLQDKRIRRAVETHLSGRQFDQTTEQPDLYLTYYLTIEQKVRSDTVHTTVGVGRYDYPWYGGVGTDTRISQYDQSRLTIDIHAADSDELVWRGVAIYRLKTYKTPQDAAVAAQQTVDKILWQFPPDGIQ